MDSRSVWLSKDYVTVSAPAPSFARVASTETFPTHYRATPHVICTNPAATSA